MRILLAGKNGQIGWELQRTLATIGEVVAVGRNEMDLANPDSIQSTIREIKPALIVNAAAYTAVDKAEAEPELAMAVNGRAPGIIAEEAKQIGAGVIHYSTDYVFDGAKTGPYTEEDAPNPISVYGQTKLAGERAIQAAGTPFLILRTSWVYSNRGKNFLLTILRLAKERDELKIVDDQIGAPTWARAVAETTARILAQWYSSITNHDSRITDVKLPLTQSLNHDSRFTLDASRLTSDASRFTDMCGLYHLTASGETTWYGFARKILDLSAPLTHHDSRLTSNASPRLVPIETNDYPTPARRPKNSRLDNSKLIGTFGFVPPTWDVMLKECIRDLADDRKTGSSLFHRDQV